MPKFRISSVKTQTVIIDTDKCEEYEQILIKEWGAQQFAETHISETEFNPDGREESFVLSWEENYFGNTEEIE